MDNNDSDFNNILWDILSKHYGHRVVIAKYGHGNPDESADICLECEDCNEVLLDAGVYTICAREDGFDSTGEFI